MILLWKVASANVASLLKEQGKQCPRSPASLRVTEKYTIITNILNAVTHLQLEFCWSSQDLFKHATIKNHHNYLQNRIKSISTWSLPNHQRSNNFLNITSAVVTTYCKVYRWSKSMCSWMLGSRPLWRNYRMRTKWETSQPWLSESIVTQPWVKPHAGAGDTSDAIKRHWRS